MRILDALLRRPKVYRLRKKYDKMRERVDKFPVVEKRIEMLKSLDQLEPHIVSLEEHPMPKFEQRRLSKYIEAGLRKIEFLANEEKKRLKGR